MDTDLPLADAPPAPAPAAPPEIGGALDALLAAIAEFHGLEASPEWALGITLAEVALVLGAMVLGALVARRAAAPSDADDAPTE